jgi:hypothetical protein
MYTMNIQNDVIGLVVSRIEEQRKFIKKNEEKNPKLLFVHVHVYA